MDFCIFRGIWISSEMQWAGQKVLRGKAPTGRRPQKGAKRRRQRLEEKSEKLETEKREEKRKCYFFGNFSRSKSK